DQRPLLPVRHAVTMQRRLSSCTSRPGSALAKIAFPATNVFGVALAIKLRPQINPVEIGSGAPAFRATNLRTNQPATLADYRGKVVLVNIWATWCPPCRAEMPSMERLHQRLAGTDFRIAAVSVDGDAFYNEEQAGPREIMAFA